MEILAILSNPESLGHHVPKGYICLAMAFSLGVGMHNLRLRKNREVPVHRLEPCGTPQRD